MGDVQVRAIAKRIEEKPREGKQSWFRIHTHEKFTLEIKGPDGSDIRPSYSNMACWSTTAKGLIEQKLIDVPAIYTVEVSENLNLAPTIKAIAADGTGEVLYPTEAHKAAESASRGGPRSGGRSGPQHPEWSYKPPEERTAERRSIESQKAGEYATAILVQAMAGDGRDSERTADSALEWLEQAIPRVALAIRTAATQTVRSPGSEAARKGGESKPRPTGRTSGSAAASSRPTTSEPEPSPSEPERSPAFQRALAAYGGDLAALQKAYRAIFDKAPDLATMADQELITLAKAREPAEVAS
jgi:hypothetical protein